MVRVKNRDFKGLDSALISGRFYLTASFSQETKYVTIKIEQNMKNSKKVISIGEAYYLFPALCMAAVNYRTAEDSRPQKLIEMNVISKMDEFLKSGGCFSAYYSKNNITIKAYNDSYGFCTSKRCFKKAYNSINKIFDSIVLLNDGLENRLNETQTNVTV